MDNTASSIARFENFNQSCIDLRTDHVLDAHRQDADANCQKSRLTAVGLREKFMSSGSFSHIDFPSRQRGFISMRIALRPILISLAVPMFLGLAMDAAGGVNSGPGATTSSFGQFAVTQPPHSSGQTATLLPDGRWLLIGGESGGKIIGALTILGNDGVPASNQILPTALAHPRSGHTATVLPDGTVLILGGNGADGSIVTQAEVFDPATGTVTTLPDGPGLWRRFAGRGSG
jgi:hypothetical protein